MQLYNKAMNSSINGLNESFVEMYREQLSDEMALTLLPAILILCFIIIIGLVGNCLVFYVYYYKFTSSSARTAILVLAFSDLITCTISIPGEIIDMRYSYNFTSELLCRGVRLVATVVLIASGFVLVTVAVDRYQRICHPLGNHLTAKAVWKRVLFLYILATLFAVPAPIVYGIAEVATPMSGVYGSECSTNQFFKSHPLPIAYSVILLLVFVTAFTIMIVIYVLIGRKVLRQNKFRKNVRVRKGSIASQDTNHRHTVCSTSQENEPSLSDGVKNSSIVQEEPENNMHQEESKVKQHNNNNGTKLTRKSSVIRHLRKLSSTGDARTRKTTMMLFFITLVFVLSFLPHIALKAVQALNKNFMSSLSVTGVIFYNIFVRSCFFNTAVNFFIYGFCSPKFRHECRNIFLKLTFWIKNKRRASIRSDDIQ